MVGKMTENIFESKLIEYLSSGVITEKTEEIEEKPLKYNIIREKLWEYRSDIKTTEDLWKNFKEILEQHNQSTLDNPLSVVEFEQVKRRLLEATKTPYEAGKFLYGLNGVSQIEIDLDDGRHVFLTVFKQDEIGAGDTIYQIVNQIERPAVIPGKLNRRFDTTLLINGLPIIQIEEKTNGHDVNEALNQMHQYIVEKQYSDIFSTLQILVAMTPTSIKYMANTTADKFNKDFAFHWQRKKDNSRVNDWKEFSDLFLTIPMAHQMATNYMVLDGTKNKQKLIVMRPYQVYATQEIINKLKKLDFDMGLNKVGYVWHTTGSGKTITSFKTAFLASRLSNIEKVVFVVDRIALTKQTYENYQSYDPNMSIDENNAKLGSIIGETSSTTELNKKLKSKNVNDRIIVTSIQKLDTLVKRKSFKEKEINKKMLFIVDEAHRSTGGESFANIQKIFKQSAWVGYTGTPMFDETTKGLRTEDIFGELLHAYTIREAIVDRNVLGFKVDFETTIPEKEMKEKYLPDYYKNKYPRWTEEQIKYKIDNLTSEDMDDAVESSFYDENKEHIKLVVEDIYKNWRNRSNDGKYNAILTTHVGGGKASTPMAKMYFDEFKRVNEENEKNGKLVLKVAVTFSQNTSNTNYMVENNNGLHEAIEEYNRIFGTNFDMSTVSEYTQDVMERLNKKIDDKKYLDLVIVVDQLLTGFDAPELNTLYVDRTLKGAGLIQAYSRTNRVHDMQEKPWGRIVNYRWPAYNEKLMNDALAIYSNKDSAQLSEEERKLFNTESGVVVGTFKSLFEKVKEIVEKLRKITNDFNELPPSEKKQEEMLGLLREYNIGISKLKQYKPENKDGEEIGFDYNNPDKLIKALGMKPEEEERLTSNLKNELKEKLAEQKKVSIYEIELRMTHIKDIKINYDYLTELLENLLNQVHEEKMKEAEETKEKINKFANGLDDRNYANKIKNTADMIMKKEYEADEYPVKLENGNDIIEKATNKNIETKIYKFRVKWGIADIITTQSIKELFSKHRYGEKDLDDTNQIQEIVTEATKTYKEYAQEEVKELSKIKYRNSLREAIYEFADELVRQ